MDLSCFNNAAGMMIFDAVLNLEGEGISVVNSKFSSRLRICACTKKITGTIENNKYNNVFGVRPE